MWKGLYSVSLHKVNCESFNIVYLIECTKENCKESKYIGETGRLSHVKKRNINNNKIKIKIKNYIFFTLHKIGKLGGPSRSVEGLLSMGPTPSSLS